MSDITNEEWYTEFSNLCLSLSMDDATKKDAINKYLAAKDVNLDGKPIYWLACALYDSCFSKKLVTISGESQRGNYISFTQLLKTIGLKFETFMHKHLDVWQITANRTDEFRKHVDSLRRRWIVTQQIYNKYNKIFDSIGKSMPDVNFRIKRKARREVTPIELYKFTWTFYCNVKAAFPNALDEVLSSSLLLLAVTDYCFAEAILSEPNLLTEDGKNAFKQSENNSIIDLLCSQFLNMESTEAKRIRDYHLKPLVKQYFTEGILKPGLENDKGIFESSVFDSNVKSITNEYDTYVLKQGDYDSRLFLDNSLPPTRPLGDRTPSKALGLTIPRTPSDLSHKVKRNLMKSLMDADIPQTPLSNRNFLPAKQDDHITRTPISEQADILNRLNNLIINYRNEPSPELKKILGKFDSSITREILKICGDLSDRFLSAYCNGEANAMDFAQQRLDHGTRLFYRVFELVVCSEAHRCSAIALKNILSNVQFISATFAMSLEIVLNTYGSSERKFPWILKALGLHPFIVGRVIEALITNDTGLSRTMIKHLNTIEETMYESMVWQSDSPVYDQLAECNPPRPPRYEDVKPVKVAGSQTPNTLTRPSDHRFAALSGSSLADRRRGLTPLSNNASPFENMDRRNQGTLQPNFKIAVPAFTITAPQAMEVPSSASREGAMTPISALANNMAVNMGVMSPPPRPLLRKSLQMFFRKIYNLVSLRIRNLADKLDLSSEVLQKIWTVFEYAMTNHLHLFQDRHIDQIMICSTYLIVKAEELKITFRQIIECYRQQPQVNQKQYIYRNVLLQTSTLPGTLMCSCKGATEVSQERGDIIKFYNQVFVNHISGFIKLVEGQNGKLNLTAPGSPMPNIYSLTPGGYLFSPRRIESHNLTVSPRKASSSTKPYVFGESPTKEAQDLNERIAARDQKKRRLFKNDGEKKKKTEPIKLISDLAHLRYDS